MPVFKLGSKDVISQTDTNQPIIGNNVQFPAGHVLQIKRSYLRDVFDFTSTDTGYTFGSAATRANDTAGQIVDALTTTITKTSATSYFLITYNLN